RDMRVWGWTVMMALVAALPAMPRGAEGQQRMHTTAGITIDKRGAIRIELFPEDAPKTVESFIALSKKGFYDGLTFHRIVPGFVAQGGDPKGDGTGGPGYTVPGEFTDKVPFDKPGIVAMARPGNDVNGNGSQFFITLAPAP